MYRFFWRTGERSCVGLVGGERWWERLGEVRCPGADGGVCVGLLGMWDFGIGVLVWLLRSP